MRLFYVSADGGSVEEGEVDSSDYYDDGDDVDWEDEDDGRYF